MALTTEPIDKGPTVLGVSSMMMMLATICVVLRAWVRIKRKNWFLADDAFNTVAYFFLWASFAVVSCAVIYGGLGKPLLVNYAKDPQILVRFLQILFTQEMVAPIVITTTRFSLLAMYWHIFPTSFMRRGCTIAAVLSIMWMFGVIFPSVFRCSPVSAAWDLFGQRTHCSTAIGDWVAWQDGIPEFIINVYMFVLPVYEVVRLRASVRTRIAICAVFLVGIFSVSSSVVRFVLGYRVHKYGATTGGGDATLDSADLLLWIHVEMCTGYIAACLPSLQPIVAGILTKMGLASKRKSLPPPEGRNVITVGGSGPESGPNSRAHSSRKNLVGGTTTTSSDRLPDRHEFLPDGYPAEQWKSVKGPSSSLHSDDVPVQAIGVKTDLEWQENRKH